MKRRLENEKCFYVVIESSPDEFGAVTVHEPVFISRHISRAQSYVDNKNEDNTAWIFKNRYHIVELEPSEQKIIDVQDYIKQKGVKTNIKLLASEIDNLVERHLLNEKLKDDIEESSCW